LFRFGVLQLKEIRLNTLMPKLFVPEKSYLFTLSALYWRRDNRIRFLASAALKSNHSKSRF